MRADAQRNYDHLVTTARAVFAEEGPDASLNEVARRAGVGPGTLYRHFPTREALLVAVFRERILTLCGQASEMTLAEWLRVFLVHAQTDGGLSATMASSSGLDCHALLRSAAGGLLAKAQEAGEVRADVEVDDLFQLITGLAQAPRAQRLLDLALEGVMR
ncbi:TetR/AcrR family transcriptional regulator [Nonomuraea sp. NPDC050556]|uniref:TetR/AcrR family transcriptional regulator n=1 Tax=Nonomuraea sp. NPDC050556 TaxID=3364369 RepID=UPI0037A4BF18